MSMFHNRQGYTVPHQAYFYTISVNNFVHLLKDDQFKHIIIESLQYLTANNLAELYGYVLMPNHIHLLWNMIGVNGKESPAGSFSKYTAHRFKKYLQETSPSMLEQFKSDKRDRQYQFWKRDALAIPVSTETIMLQKLDYIHQNPIREKWKLCDLPEEYKWSSAAFYHSGKDEFGILKHFKDAYA